MLNTRVSTRRRKSQIDGSPPDVTTEFLELRPRLISIAHRVLGNWSEAEDVVQDAWLRWQACDRRVVENPTAFLVTTTTRLSINAATSARARREESAGPRLSEVVCRAEDPTVGAERQEDLELALGLLLERLTPAERAAFLLRHAFDYPYPQIATALHTSEANARQMVCRAGRRLQARRPRQVNHSDHRSLVQGFVLAARLGQVEAFEGLLLTEVRAPERAAVAAAASSPHRVASRARRERS